MSENVELLEKTMSYIERHSRQWNQQNWETCFAGITLRMAGDDPARYRNKTEVYIPSPIPVIAGKMLGIELPDQIALFSPRNTMLRLRGHVDYIKNRVVVNVPSIEKELVSV